MKRFVLGGLVVLGAFAGRAIAQSNIDNSVPDKFAWGENVGVARRHVVNERSK